MTQTIDTRDEYREQHSWWYTFERTVERKVCTTGSLYDRHGVRLRIVLEIVMTIVIIY